MLEIRHRPVRLGLDRLGQQQVADLVSSEVRNLSETDPGPVCRGEHRSDRVSGTTQRVGDATLGYALGAKPKDLLVVDH